MINNISKLKDIYLDKFLSCKSNFRDCSINKNNHTNLVNSIKDCINFDLVKNIVFFGRDVVHSTDSLSFDEVNNELLFIEFKDSRYKSCKNNVVEKGEDSFLINRIIISLFGTDSMNSIPRKYILVLDKTKNSYNFVSYYAAKQSNKLYENSMYKFLKEKLVDCDYLGNKLFDEIEIVSEDNFDDVIKNI